MSRISVTLKATMRLSRRIASAPPPPTVMASRNLSGHSSDPKKSGGEVTHSSQFGGEGPRDMPNRNLSKKFAGEARKLPAMGCRSFSSASDSKDWLGLRRDFGLVPDPSGKIGGVFKDPTSLKKKLEVLCEVVGLTKSECCQLVNDNPEYLFNASAEVIKANALTVIGLHDSRSEALKYLRVNPIVLFMGSVDPGIAVLQEAGMKSSHILSFLKNKTRWCTRANSESLEKKVNRVAAMVSRPDTVKFGNILDALVSGTDATMKTKEVAFSEFGWDEGTFWMMVKKTDGGILNQSVENIRRRMNFFQQQCRVEPLALVEYPKLVANKSLEDLRFRHFVYSKLQGLGFLENKRTKKKPKKEKNEILIAFNKSKDEFKKWMNKTGKEEVDGILKDYKEKFQEEAVDVLKKYF